MQPVMTKNDLNVFIYIQIWHKPHLTWHRAFARGKKNYRSHVSDMYVRLPSIQSVKIISFVCETMRQFPVCLLLIVLKKRFVAVAPTMYTKSVCLSCVHIFKIEIDMCVDTVGQRRSINEYIFSFLSSTFWYKQYFISQVK